MIAERRRLPGESKTDGTATPAERLYLWVAPDGDAYDWGGDAPVRLPGSFDDLAATHDGLDRPVAFLADGWRLFHARPRPV